MLRKNQILALIGLGIIFLMLYSPSNQSLTQTSDAISTGKPEIEDPIENPIFNTPDLEIPRSAANYNPVGTYQWWDPMYSYRVPIEINSSYIKRRDYSVGIEINFTKILETQSWEGEFDGNSIRVIEYDGSGNLLVGNSLYTDNNKYVIPSKFIPRVVGGASYNAITNANGTVYFEMDGLTAKNTNRTYMIYFDIIENNGEHTIPTGLEWNKDYNWNSDAVGDGTFHLS